MENTATLLRFAATQSPARARAVVDAILAKSEPKISVVPVEQLAWGKTPALAEAVAAFERDMQPICNAVAAALKDGDKHALEGLKMLLPELLTEMQSSELADLLTRELGRALLTGLTQKPEVNA